MSIFKFATNTGEECVNFKHKHVQNMLHRLHFKRNYLHLSTFLEKHKTSGLSGYIFRHSLDRPEIFQIIIFSLDYPDTSLNYPDNFRIIRKLSRSPQHISRSSGLFLHYLDTFSRLSRHCLDRTETFLIIHTLFRLSGHIF